MQITKILSSQYDVSNELVRSLLSRGKISILRQDRPSSTPITNVRVKYGDVMQIGEFSLSLRVQEDKLPPILYEDDRILVINKPSGLAVHCGPKITEHLEEMLPQYSRNGIVPLLVHRLDKDASGAMMLAKTPEVATLLASKLSANSVDAQIEKVYWAMCYGKLPLNRRKGRIVTNLYEKGERITSFSDQRQAIDDAGRVAVTLYRWMQAHRRGKETLGLMELRPVTGRRHQLRVHMAEQLESPILGDDRYGREDGKKLHLHARRVSIMNWFQEGKPLNVVAPIPQHFIDTMNRVPLRLNEVPKFALKR